MSPHVGNSNTGRFIHCHYRHENHKLNCVPLTPERGCLSCLHFRLRKEISISGADLFFLEQPPVGTKLQTPAYVLLHLAG